MRRRLTRRWPRASTCWSKRPPVWARALAYLVPAATHAHGDADAVVVVTATKALQEQLTRDDLPFLAAALPGRPLRFAMLKGRSNYLCRAQARRDHGRRRRGAALDFGDEGVHRRRSERRRSGSRMGRDDRRPATGPTRPGPSPTPCGRRCRSTLASAPAPPTATPATSASPRRPGSGPRRPTSWWSTPTSTPPTWPRAATCLPPHDRRRLRRGPHRWRTPSPTPSGCG